MALDNHCDNCYSSYVIRKRISMLYTTTINMEHENIYAITYATCSTQNESVKCALDSYEAAGYTADQITSIETMAYEST